MANVMKMKAAGGNQDTVNRQRFQNAKIINQGDIGEAPDWLPDAAKALWELIIAHYEKLPVICELDAPALTSLCLAAAKMTELDKKISECWDTDEEKGLVKLRKEYEATFKSLSQNFGLTPRDRSSLAAAMKEATVDLEQRDELLEALSLD